MKPITCVFNKNSKAAGKAAYDKEGPNPRKAGAEGVWLGIHGLTRAGRQFP